MHKGVLNNGLGGLYQDARGTIWIAPDFGIPISVSGNWNAPIFKGHPTLCPTKNFASTVYDFIEDEYGRLWVATYLGLVVHDPVTNEQITYYQNIDDPDAISQSTIKELYKDAHGRIWLGSPSGIDLYDPYFNQFELLTHKANNPNSLSSNNIFSILEDSRGYIWFAHIETGITVMWKDASGREQYHHLRKGEGEKSLRGDQMYYLEEDKLGRIWATSPYGLHIIDWQDRSGFNYEISVVPNGPLTDKKLPENRIYQIVNDENNKNWMATHSAGVLTFDPAMNGKQYLYEIQDTTQTSKDFVVTLSIDPEKRVWLGNFNLGGSVIEDPLNDSSFKRIKGDSAFYLKTTVNGYAFSEEGVLISTSNGVFYYEDRNELLTNSNPKHTKFTTASGLSNNFTSKIVPGTPETYWVSSGKGLSLINIEDKTAKSFNKIINTKDFEFNHNSGTKTSDGIIYFGSINGVVRFDPSKIVENQITPRLHFRDFRILNETVKISSHQIKGETVLRKDIAFTEAITLLPKDKIFSVQLDAVNFTLPEETKYAYKLEGFEDAWTETTDPKITRSNLDPGSYTLFAKAANNDGLWSEPISLSIKVLPPWYRTWWAILLFIVAGVGALYLFLKLRLRQARDLELARAQEREIFRQRSSQDFHDEAGTRMTRIALISEVLKQELQEHPKAQEHLAQIDSNLDDLNNGMRDFIWTLDPTKDNAFETLSRFTEFAGSFCEYGNIQFKCDTLTEDLKSKELNMAERRHLLMILKEGLNNSVKHGKPTLVTLTVHHQPGMLRIRLKDNGKGFDQETIRGGNGLKNMKNRAETLGGTLKVETRVNGGTELILTLETTRLGN